MDLEKSVLKVAIKPDGESFGSAFFCSPKGYIVTVRHVWDDLVKLNLQMWHRPYSLQPAKIEISKSVYEGQFLGDDLVVLRCNSIPEDALPLTLLSSVSAVQEIKSYGFSRINQSRGMNADGKLLGLVSTLGNIQRFQVESAQIDKGFSGAPCIDVVTRQIIGVIGFIVTASKQGRSGHDCFVTPAPLLIEKCPVLQKRLPPIVELLKYPKRPRTTARLNEGVYDTPTLSSRYNRQVDPIALIENTNGQIKLLFGIPGSGKSRLITEVAALCWDQWGYVPIVVKATELAVAKGTTIYERLAELLRKDSAIAIEQLDRRIEALFSENEYKCAVFIDALDEMDPNEVSNLVSFLLSSELLRNHFVLITSRPQALGLDESEFDVYSINGFDPFSSSLPRAILGDLANPFCQQIREKHLGSALNTPLLLKLAAEVYKDEKFLPEGILGIFANYVRGVCERAPEKKDKPSDLLSCLAKLAFYQQKSSRYDLDAAVIGIHHNAFEDDSKWTSEEVDYSLRTSRYILQHSGLVWPDGGSLGWLHANIRDYLSAEWMYRNWKQSKEPVEKLLVKYLSYTWSSAIIMFLTMVSIDDDAVIYRLLKTNGSDVYMEPTICMFISNCIKNGVKLSDKVFEVFCNSALRACCEDAHFGDRPLCRELLSNELPNFRFFHLLELQRIPQVKDVIMEVKNRTHSSVIREWPDSEASRQASPGFIYTGPLATVPAIYVPE